MIGILFWNTNITTKSCSDEERNNRIEDAIVGDFNANPFERLMTDAGYVHAIYDSATVERIKHREVYRKKRQMFYNPMWNFWGDLKTPKGTYYGESGKAEKFFWNIFDQVIISADTIKAFDKESLI